jgi:hypothetical protein
MPIIDIVAIVARTLDAITWIAAVEQLVRDRPFEQQIVAKPKRAARQASDRVPLNQSGLSSIVARFSAPAAPRTPIYC